MPHLGFRRSVDPAVFRHLSANEPRLGEGAGCVKKRIALRSQTVALSKSTASQRSVDVPMCLSIKV
jgi:hypothetical protein